MKGLLPLHHHWGYWPQPHRSSCAPVIEQWTHHAEYFLVHPLILHQVSMLSSCLFPWKLAAVSGFQNLEKVEILIIVFSPPTLWMATIVQLLATPVYWEVLLDFVQVRKEAVKLILKETTVLHCLSWSLEFNLPLKMLANIIFSLFFISEC